MSVENPAVATTYQTNNYYNNDPEIRDANTRVTVGGIENLPPGTTEQDVQNAITNRLTQDLLNQIISTAYSGEYMDPEQADFMNELMISLRSDLNLDVNPEVQTAVDADFGETSSDFARTFMDMMMELFKETANDERMEEAQNTDSDGTTSEGGEGGGNWLVKLARALAEVQSEWLDKLMSSYEAMQKNTESDPGPDASQEEKDDYTASQKAFIQAQAEVTAYGRLFGMSSEVTSNVIKSVGDGLTSVARKQ